MGNLSVIKTTSLWTKCLTLLALAPLTSLVGCTSSDFSGGGSKAANLREDRNTNPDGTGDGADGNDGSDGDGMDGSDYNPDDDGLGGGDDQADSGGDDLGTDDGSVNPDDPKDLATSDDETKKKYLSDATISRTENDEPFDLTVETLMKGVVVQSSTLHFEDEGDATEGNAIRLACFNQKDTCLRLTFTGRGDKGITQVLGASECTEVRSNSGNTATIHADTNGNGGFGECVGPNEKDDLVVITCPQSTRLKVKSCGG